MDCLAWARGEEPCNACYICHLRTVFAAVKRVMRKDGTCFCVIGDSYNGSGGAGGDYNPGGLKEGQPRYPGWNVSNLKPKDLCLVPFRFALAMQADGWWMRSDTIWCLSGGVWVYARAHKGPMPMTIKDIARLNPQSVELWNGQKWVQLIRIEESPCPEHPIELELRSGETIGCTPEHLWPTQRGVIATRNLKIGDIIQRCQLPEPEETHTPSCLPNEEIGWFIGTYLADGSRDSSNTIQIASHINETDRFHRLQSLAKNYGATCRKHQTSTNGMTICLCSKILNAIIDTHIAGKGVKRKHLAVKCWLRSNHFLYHLLLGYLEGDGHYEKENNRWRLGFARNYALEKDLRTLCARLGIQLRLKKTTSLETTTGKRHPSFRGEIRFDVSNHFNAKNDTEITGIHKSRACKFWNIEVEDPHLFALASGVLTHNSKTNCLPESVRDRPTKSHEYIFMLAKRGTTFFWVHRDTRERVYNHPKPDYRWQLIVDGIVIKEVTEKPKEQSEEWKRINLWKGHAYYFDQDSIREPHQANRWETHYKYMAGNIDNYTEGKRDSPGMHGAIHPSGRNARTVWTLSTKPSNWDYCRNCQTLYEGKARRRIEKFRENGRVRRRCPECGITDKWVDHFAAFPPDLVEKCIKAGSSKHGVCGECGAQWERAMEKTGYRDAGCLSSEAGKKRARAPGQEQTDRKFSVLTTGKLLTYKQTGWRPTCSCHAAVTPSIVFDPFMGSGTTAKVAAGLGRNFFGIDINPAYCQVANARAKAEMERLPLFSGVENGKRIP